MFTLSTYCYLNLFPNDKILNETKLKAFADDKLNNKNDIYVFDRVENIVGKGENAGYQHFLLFPQSFQKACFSGCHYVIMGLIRHIKKKKKKKYVLSVRRFYLLATESGRLHIFCGGERLSL